MAKLYTAKQAIAVASETVEAFGGAGYVEDSGIPRLLRDAQVLSIWEGTTNVLSLDALRAMERVDALSVWISDVRRRVGLVQSTALRESVTGVSRAVQHIEEYAARASKSDKDFQQTGARALTYAIARTEAAILLVEHADSTSEPAAATAAQRWCARDLDSLVVGDAHHRGRSALLVLPDHET